MLDRRQFLLAAAAAPLAGRLAPTLAATPPAAEFSHPEWLVDAGWLLDHRADPGVKVIAFGSKKAYAAGHVPGAALIEMAACMVQETTEAAIAEWRAKVAGILTDNGIGPDDTVVAYDGGDFYAARVWWSLTEIGHPKVAVLDGGLPAWTAGGGPRETGEPAARTPLATPHPVHADDAMIARLDEAVAALDAGDAIFVDARTAKDFAKGHIPGAVSLPMELNRVADGPAFWRPAAELAEVYAAIPRDRLVIPYCIGGIRSAATFFTLRELGYERVSLFTGSWAEWSAHPELPVETGS